MQGIKKGALWALQKKIIGKYQIHVKTIQLPGKQE